MHFTARWEPELLEPDTVVGIYPTLGRCILKLDVCMGRYVSVQCQPQQHQVVSVGMVNTCAHPSDSLLSLGWHPRVHHKIKRWTHNPQDCLPVQHCYIGYPGYIIAVAIIYHALIHGLCLCGVHQQLVSVQQKTATWKDSSAVSNWGEWYSAICGKLGNCTIVYVFEHRVQSPKVV